MYPREYKAFLKINTDTSLKGTRRLDEKRTQTFFFKLKKIYKSEISCCYVFGIFHIKCAGKMICETKGVFL